MKLKNRTVLITGGTSGIGLEFVKQLTGQGANIIVTGRNPEALYKIKHQFPDVHTFQSDVSKAQDIEALYKDVTKQFPELSILINNAGIMRQIDLQDSSLNLEDINREIATNLTGIIQMNHRFLPHLLTQKSAAIINVTSSIAFLPYSITPIYSASKAGAHAYTKALRLQLENTNVKVMEVLPPGVKTNLQKGWELPPPEERMMEADKMVSDVINGILKDRQEITPGLARVIKVLSRLIPNSLISFGHGEFKKLKQLKNKK
ncbi:SDR family oxidoreductase [Epilithonimonas caeni]|uniref:SDR family oxidoreductase n=1 Tax=Epilithonimonas caeni TaxID=365343 RepID=UPI0003F9EBBD|nr:SDR family NAD(P)-dependent oxidoreductase [Epilithonimonas caeni]